MKKRSILSSLMLCAAAVQLPAQQATPVEQNMSLKNEIQETIKKGVAYLVTQQKDDGSWSEADNPAIGSLALSAMMGDPGRKDGEFSESVEKGMKWLRSLEKPDGGIYVQGNNSYNSSIALMALMARNAPEDANAIESARKYVVSQQQDYDKKGETDNIMDGGIGYGGSLPHSDMSNSLFALEALYYAKARQADSGVATDKETDLDWDAAITFIHRSQNDPANKEEFTKNVDDDNKGGFVYFPGDSKAGTTKDGKALRSYGSISYAGLLSYIYAGLTPDDPRVTMVTDWLSRHYTLEENPGMEQQGLFYYYHTMAKGLTIAGVDELTLTDGTKVNWRKDLTARLLNLQKPDGSWLNDAASRWKENDRVLVTSYVLLALEHVYRGL